MIKNKLKAPNFKLLSTGDKEIELKKLKSKYIVLYFYPKDDTPGCTLETKDFNKLLNKFKKEEMDEYRAWLEQNGYDYNDKKLSLGYIKLGQIDITKEFGTESFRKVYDAMQSNLNISSIAINKEKNVSCNYPYDLDSDDWQKIQLEGLRKGYESHRMR